MQPESAKMCFEIEVDCISLTSSTTKTTTTTKTLKDVNIPDRTKSPLGPRVVQSLPRNYPTANSPRPSAMKRTPSNSPRPIVRTVSFAVDANDRPLPDGAQHVYPRSRSRSPPRRHRTKSPSMPRHMFTSTGVKIGEDFTLYPSPSPSPPRSPILKASPLPRDTEARMKARQKVLEDEIEELTRRALARETFTRESLRQQAAGVDALMRERTRSPTFDNITTQNVTRKRSKDGSVDLSSPADFKSERVSSFFPSPLPSPATSYIRSTHTETRSNNDSAQTSPKPTTTRFSSTLKYSDLKPFTMADLERIRARIRDRPVHPSASSDSLTCVVGEFTDEEMRDAESSVESLSRDQCQRCGLFGHVLEDCRTPALRRKRARESEAKEKEGGEDRPVKGIRHVRWLGFGGGR